MVASPHAKLHLHLHHLAQETDVVQDMLQGREEAKGFHLAKRSGSSLYEGDPAAPTSCFNPNQLQFSLKAACGARPGRAGDPTRQSQGPVTGYARRSLETPRALQQPEELASWLKCVLAAKLRSACRWPRAKPDVRYAGDRVRNQVMVGYHTTREMGVEHNKNIAGWKLTRGGGGRPNSPRVFVNTRRPQYTPGSIMCDLRQQPTASLPNSFAESDY